MTILRTRPPALISKSVGLGGQPSRTHSSEFPLAKRTQASFAKRQKEAARQARRQDKQSRRLDAKQMKSEADMHSPAAETDEDPDLAGIKLGPQPVADEG